MSARGDVNVFGPKRLDDGRVRFRLWAPACDTVQLEIEGMEPQAMQADDEGWFECTTQAAPGSRYRFRVREDLAVPDPASRFQPQDVLGPSELTDPAAHVWTQEQWRGRPWHETVIYELHVGACGGYAGVREQLERLAQLGVTAIELMPLADFPGKRNWGYDGVAPYAPDAMYGWPDELKSLIDAAHALGLMVFLDVVYNHFGPEGNFLPVYAPEFFRDDIHTPWGAAIDFRRPQVRAFFIDNALYWLNEFRFDGLRLDAVHAIHDKTFLPELAAAVRANTAPGRHVHVMLENEHNDAALLEHDYVAQWNDDGHNLLHVLLTGEAESYYENYTQNTGIKLARVLEQGFVYQGEPSPTHDGKPRGTPSDHLSPQRFILFLQNHDQVGNRALGERLSTLAEPEALRAVIALQLLCPQTPLLFMGEEWGSRAPFLFFTDFHDELAQAVREGRRKEFASFAAFADEAQRERIPDPNAARTYAQSMPDFDEAERGDHANWQRYYRRLLALRRDQLWPRLHGVRARSSRVLSSHAAVAYWRLGDGCKLRIAVNLGAQDVAIRRSSASLLFESREGVGALAARGTLPASSTCAWLSAASSQEPSR